MAQSKNSCFRDGLLTCRIPPLPLPSPKGPSSSPPEGQGDNGENPTRDKDEGHEPEADSSVESDPLLATPTVPFGSQPATALLPEIQTPTGEEGEKKIVQVRIGSLRQ